MCLSVFGIPVAGQVLFKCMSYCHVFVKVCSLGHEIHNFKP